LVRPAKVFAGTTTVVKGLAPAMEIISVGMPPAEEEQTLGEQLVDVAGDPADVKRLCDAYGLRREDLARLTGFSLRALAEWSAGKLPSEPAKRRLQEIRRLLDALAQVVKAEAIPSWLKARNPAFENMTPLQVIEVGEIDRLWQMVHFMSSDAPG
jgi:DNA-binding transcriptional regulator YiaG